MKSKFILLFLLPLGGSILKTLAQAEPSLGGAVRYFAFYLLVVSLVIFVGYLLDWAKGANRMPKLLNRKADK